MRTIFLLLLCLFSATAGTAVAAEADAPVEIVSVVVEGQTLKLPVPAGYVRLPESRPEYETLRNAAEAKNKNARVAAIFMSPESLRFLDGERSGFVMRYVVCVMNRSELSPTVTRPLFEKMKDALKQEGDGSFLSGLKGQFEQGEAGDTMKNYGIAHETDRYLIVSFALSFRNDGMSLAAVLLSVPLDGWFVQYTYFASFDSVDVPAAELQKLGDEAKADAERWAQAGRVFFASEGPLMFPPSSRGIGAMGVVGAILTGVVVASSLARKRAAARRDAGHNPPM